MKDNHTDKIEKEIESKYKRKDKRKKTGMKISGGSVKKLQKVIK